ncbi:hypothetical protein WJX84_003896 [Apatococcus fuscideae]|uniref:Uncharacterized protein n=1 Tax=Apatococcus fuscideae TaxID=2026836 RepID=A0AAW1TJ98_9CHLO
MPAGQPYSCLGKPEEVQSVLPPLSVNKQRKTSKRKPPKTQLSSHRDAVPSSARTQAIDPFTTNAAKAPILSADQKRPMKPGPMDRADMSFPMASVAIAEFRRRQLKTAAALFMNLDDAQADAADPKAWGTPAGFSSQAGQGGPSTRPASPGKSLTSTPRAMDPSSQQLMSGSLPHTEGLKLGDGGSEAMILALPGARSSIAGSIPSAAHSARDPLLLRPPSAVPGGTAAGSRLGSPKTASAMGTTQGEQAGALVRRSQSPLAVNPVGTLQGADATAKAGWGPLTSAQPAALMPSRLAAPGLQPLKQREIQGQERQSVQQLQKAIWAAHRGKGGKEMQSFMTSLPSAPKQPPTFPVLCPAFQAAPGDNSPICKWRNSFLQARQRQRRKLQMALWQRSQQRADARSRTGLAAAACALLMHHFQDQGHKRATSPSHGKPAVSMVSAARGSIDLVAVMAAQRPPSDLTEEEQMEMDMLDAFYRQLCRFAYAIKALDPICMALIYEIKILLETGQAITRGLLIRSLDALAWSATGMGMQSTNNNKLQLLLRFVGRIVGLEEPEIVQHSRQLGILQMIYSPAEVAAKEAAICRASSGLSLLSQSSGAGNVMPFRRMSSVVSERRKGKDNPSRDDS